MRGKVPIALDGIRTCTSGIRARHAADYTTKLGPCVCVCVCVLHMNSTKITKHDNSHIFFFFEFSN